MKTFFKNNSYTIVKMFLNQFAISIFGTTLAFATQRLENPTLLIASSIFSIVFYLFLLYTIAWETGAKDKISIDSGKSKGNLLSGLYMSVMANIPNLILALLILIGYIFGKESGAFAYEWAGAMYGIAKAIALFLQGMYVGVLQGINGNPLSYFVIVIPALLVSGLTYFLAIKHNYKK